MRTLGRGAVLMVALAAAGIAHAAQNTPESCRALRLHGKKAEATTCFEALTQSNNAYYQAEGYWGLEQWDDANNAFRAATSAPSAKPLYKVRWGMLFRERFNDKDAADLFNEALAADPSNALAYVGLAEVSSDGFDGKSDEYIAKAMELDPKLAEAHTVAADLALEDARPDDAVKQADQAIALSPYEGGSDALDAMAIRAAVAELADKDAEAQQWLDKVRAVNPGYGEAYAMVAKHLVLNRRYNDGVAYYRKAVEADPKDWAARSQLGINLMRLGEEEEPMQQLELSYNNGYRDAATVNSLRLLDSYKNFDVFKDDTTVLKLWNTESALLRPYFEEQLHKAIATYTAKYDVHLKGPVQVEVYPNHEDFAVRTMGMPGLGALGVTFGQVLAMDSPSGRTPGEFNWGATLWHEMSHVFILSATNFRVPRWFTEGLAVHEEGQADPEWANRVTPEILIAVKGKKLLPVAQLDRGFIFPQYPEQVIVSYWQGGTICDLIQQKWGMSALMGMVHSFADGKTTPEAIQANLHESPEEFDKQYQAWVDQTVGPEAANFDQWRSQLKDLVAMPEGGDSDQVIAAAAKVIKMYPEYVGDANAYEIEATAQIAKGDKKGAAATLAAYKKAGGESPTVLKKLASLQTELGDTKDAAATLDALNFIYPEDEAMHRDLGGLWLAQGNATGAVREFNAVVAMKPLDKASAEFELAKAYNAEGDKAKAEDSVLSSLEAAPDYRPAQEMLLQLESAKKSSQPVTDTK